MRASWSTSTVLVLAGITTQSAGMLALGLSLLGIAIATTALLLVLNLMREDARKAREQTTAIKELDGRATELEAHLDTPP